MALTATGADPDENAHGYSSMRLQPRAIDATPERLAKGDMIMVVNPALIDSSQRAGSIRRVTTSTIERWKRTALLDERQMVAISHCQTLWGRIGGGRGLTVDFERVAGLPGGQGYAQQEALSMIADYEKRIPRDYWQVFENVCRWDEPGGVAGSRWANDAARASQSALICVRFVADLICKWNGFEKILDR